MKKSRLREEKMVKILREADKTPVSLGIVLPDRRGPDHI